MLFYIFFLKYVLHETTTIGLLLAEAWKEELLFQSTS
jgi:hypothetical protein